MATVSFQLNSAFSSVIHCVDETDAVRGVYTTQETTVLCKEADIVLERIERLRTRMQEAQCDAFFSAAPPANQYLTEFRGTTSAVAVTLDDARFFCDYSYSIIGGTRECDLW